MSVRVAARAQASEVLVTGTVRMLVLGSGISFADRGRHRLKGIPDRWQLFAVEHLTRQGQHPRRQTPWCQ
jgi:class 3 adenylate cyclase